MRISKSRKSRASIMAHSHFGDLKITRGDVSIIIPQNNLTSCGTIKKTVNVEEMFNKKKEYDEVC